jgi:hypothetical protein
MNKGRTNNVVQLRPRLYQQAEELLRRVGPITLFKNDGLQQRDMTVEDVVRILRRVEQGMRKRGYGPWTA